MDTKIQELTDKIYREGVEKGNEEATRIIAEANNQKDSIIAAAEAEAARITSAAEKDAAELKKNTESEMKLFASQSIEALKSEITNLITGQITSENVKPVVADKAFMQKVILSIATEWAKNGALTIQTAEADELSKYFESNAKELLNKGVKIEKADTQEAAFAIAPSDGSFKVTFGEEEFMEFFKEFLRPKLIEMLF